MTINGPAPPRGSAAGALFRYGLAKYRPPQKRIHGPDSAAAIGIHGFDRLSLKGGAEGEDEVSEPQLLDPTPELPDDTPIGEVELPARIRNVLAAAGLGPPVSVRSRAGLAKYRPPRKTNPGGWQVYAGSLLIPAA